MDCLTVKEYKVFIVSASEFVRFIKLNNDLNQDLLSFRVKRVDEIRLSFVELAHKTRENLICSFIYSCDKSVVN